MKMIMRLVSSLLFLCLLSTVQAQSSGGALNNSDPRLTGDNSGKSKFERITENEAVLGQMQRDIKEMKTQIQNLRADVDKLKGQSVVPNDKDTSYTKQNPTFYKD